jgi:hypothetical protein
MQNGSVLKISTDLSQHEFAITTGDLLALNPIAEVNVTPNTPVSFTVTATYTGNGNLTYSASNLPVNATFSSDTQTFAWTPAATQAGTYNVTFTVSDGILTSNTNAAIVVSSVNQAPVITAIPNQTVTPGNQLSFEVSATDPEGKTLTYTASNLPANATFDGTSRTFRWTPTSAQSGTYTIIFTASDGVLTTSTTATVVVSTVASTANHAPVISPVPAQSIKQGSVLKFVVKATDPDGDQVTYSSTNLPVGATLNSATGVFSWSPAYDQSGNFAVSFTASDGTLKDATPTNISVVATNIAPAFVSIPIQTVLAGSNLQFTVNAVDWNHDTLVYSASNLPEGATFNAATHTFSWKPADSLKTGNYTVSFAVSDGTLTASTTATIKVTSVNHAPAISSVPAQSIQQGSILKFNVVATDPDGDQVTYSSTNLPAGATLNSATGAFSWSPAYDQSGNFAVTFTASDGSLKNSTAVSITSVAKNYAPAFVSIPPKTIAAGSNLKFAVNAIDWNHDTLVYSASGLPENATFDATTHTFSWTPSASQTGSYTVTFTVTDGILSDKKSGNIVVT